MLPSTRKDVTQQIPSLYKQAVAVIGCVKFLELYELADKSRLPEVSTPKFFEGSLAIGDLKEVPLPGSTLVTHDLQVRLRGARADFTLKGEENVVQIAMKRADEADADSSARPRFLVDEVTIYDSETREEKHLSAVFTSRAVLEVFTQALAERNLGNLRHCSTRDFTTRVWERYSDQTLPGLPLDLFDQPIESVTKTVFQGALTRYEVSQGGTAVTYFLREQNGRFLVDDVVVKEPGRPESVKALLELYVPIQGFAVGVSLGRDAGLQAEALETLQKYSSFDFSRVIWTQTRFVPNSTMSADTFLATKLNKVTVREKGTTVELGSGQFGAEVLLLKQNDVYVVDDITLIAGPDTSQHLGLKHHLRVLLAEGKAGPPEGFEIAKDSLPRRKTSGLIGEVGVPKRAMEPISPVNYAPASEAEAPAVDDIWDDQPVAPANWNDGPTNGRP